MMKALNRLFELLIAFSLCFAFTASAAANEIITGDCRAKSGNYIDVEVRLKADAYLSAGSFTLEYDSSHAEIKNVKKVITNLKLRSSDSGGRTAVAVICKNAVNLSDGAKLFSVRYKRLDDTDFKLKITAEGCADSDGKAINGIRSAVCSVSSPASAGSASSRAASKSSAKTASKAKSGSTVTASAVEVADDDGNYNFKEVYLNSEGSLIDYLPLIILAVLFIILCLIFTQNSVSRRRDKASLEERVERLEQQNED